MDRTIDIERKKKEKIERLKKKLEHWAEHNKEHAAIFRNAAIGIEAEGIRFVNVGRSLKEAAKSMDESSSHLISARDELIHLG